MRRRAAAAPSQQEGPSETTPSVEPASPSSDAISSAPTEPTKDGPPPPTNAFECNICFETPRDPVVTRCGHLYCWSCLYRWMRQRSEASQCPVCKAAVEKENVTPIYGRGRTDADDPRDKPVLDDEQLPPRPQGQRAQPGPPSQGIHGANPFLHPAAFGRLNYAGMNGNLTLATFGNFPSLFGMQIAYPHVNEPPREQPALTPEQETREQVAKVFLFLALFILVILTLF